MRAKLPGAPPSTVLVVALQTLAERDAVLQRRMALLTLLWGQGGQTQTGLMARVRVCLGRNCFGRQPELTFRRDMQFIKAVLTGAGHTLKYSRREGRQGYSIVGQAALPESQARAISGAVSELDPVQIAIWARLTPAARLKLANTLTRDVLALAVAGQRAGQPGQSRADAQREVLHRYYQTSGL